jgi:preprotein translocase subunit YajC
VATSGGVIGKVARVVDDHEVLLEVADNVRMRILKHAISEVRAKGEPVAAAADDAAQAQPKAQVRTEEGGAEK